MENKEKILWINGLKGLACIAVFLHHFLLSFYPATFYGEGAQYVKTATGFEATFSSHFWGSIINGNFAVTLFVLLAAFLASVKIMKLNDRNLPIDFFKICFKRYTRLLRPYAFWEIFLFVLMSICIRLGFNDSNFTIPCNFKELAVHILFKQWFTESSMLIGQSWTMKALLLGPIIAMFISLFSSGKRWYMPFVYLFIALGLTKCYEYYAVAALGTFIADLYYFDRVGQFIDFCGKKKLNLCFLKAPLFRNLFGIIFAVTGLYMGGYPTMHTPVEFAHRVAAFFAVRIFPDCPIPMIHGCASTVLVLGLMMLTKTRLLSSKPCNFFGDICIYVYLIHPVVLASVSYWFTNTFTSLTGNYHIGVLICFTLSFAIIIAASVISHKVSERIDGFFKYLKEKKSSGNN